MNIGIGTSALYSNTTGKFNIALGTAALYSNTSGNENLAIGPYALNLNSTGTHNLAVGSSNLNNNTTGSFNTAIGQLSQTSTTSSDHNTSIGYASLNLNTTGSSNTALGAYSMHFNTTGGENTAVGMETLYSNTTGFDNSAIGYRALHYNTEGHNNVSIGRNALFSNVSGAWNVGVGNYAGDNNTTGGDILCLGWGADVASTFLDDATAIGESSTVNASNKVRIGNSLISVIEGQVDWSYPSDGRFKRDIHENVPGLEFITRLRPVTYHFDTKAFDQHVRPEGWAEHYPAEKLAQEEELHQRNMQILHTGFIAQEVETAADEIGYDFHGLIKPQNPKDNYGIRYGEFTVPLVKAIQEQQIMIDAQNQKLAALEQDNALLRQRLDDLVKLIQEEGASGNQ